MYYDVAKGLTGRIPDTPLDLAQTTIVESLGRIYDQTDWSFQRAITYGGWLCPGNVANVGTYTTQTYTSTVIANGVATNALAVLINAPLLTTLQYRDPAYSIYNIIGLGTTDTVAYLQVATHGSNQTPGIYVVNVLDGGSGTGATASIVVNPDGTVTAVPVILTPGSDYTQPFITFSEGGTPATFNALLNAVLTLDRPWMEPTNGPGQPYMIYQAYFVAPVQDFRKFVEARDTTNAARLNFWSMTQAELAVRDPQRTEFADPDYIVPAGIDQRPGSSTFGWQMFELWPQQLSYVPYSFSFRRRGPIPQTPNDFYTTTVPYPLTEELLRWKSEETLYAYKSAQMEAKVPASGRGMMLLSQNANKQYTACLSEIISIDLNINGEAFNRIEGRGRRLSDAGYSNQLGQLNVGGYPEGS